MFKFNLTENGMGSIQIDDFMESFESDLSYCSKEMYEAHWLKASEELSAVFITSITEPDSFAFTGALRSYLYHDALHPLFSITAIPKKSVRLRDFMEFQSPLKIPFLASAKTIYAFRQKSSCQTDNKQSE
ncbi:hypothetical protein AB8E32_08505 [Marinomonas polaris]|uniref:hypothetical protein n=1 Tax=Marinomonas polaris TaxID=293552 RepID=UPI00351791F3